MSSEVKWDDVRDITNTRQPGQKTPFEPTYADLQEGPNYFRIIDPKFYGVLMYYAFGRFQKSSDEWGSGEENCPLSREVDEKGTPYRAKPYYLFKVIERRTQKIKVLRVGRQVAQMMKNYATSESWGPLTEYDICIQRGPKGAQPLYMVMPMPKKLTAEDQELIANDTLKLENHAKPATVDRVKAFIAERKKGGNAAPPPPAATRTAATKKPAPPPTPEVTNDFSDGSIDDDFENL